MLFEAFFLLRDLKTSRECFREIFHIYDGYLPWLMYVSCPTLVDDAGDLWIRNQFAVEHARFAMVWSFLHSLSYNFNRSLFVNYSLSKSLFRRYIAYIACHNLYLPVGTPDIFTSLYSLFNLGLTVWKCQHGLSTEVAYRRGAQERKQKEKMKELRAFFVLTVFKKLANAGYTCYRCNFEETKVSSYSTLYRSYLNYFDSNGKMSKLLTDYKHLSIVNFQ